MAQVVTTILHDDNPKGLRSISLDNWSGRAIVVPRGKLGELKHRPETQQEGLYFLFGQGNELPRVYIGQSHDVYDRLTQHDASRAEDEWDSAVLFVGGLDSTYISTLEHNAILDAKKAARYEILNKQNTSEYTLTEAQKITAQKYLDYIKIIIANAGFPIFEDPIDEAKGSELYVVHTTEAHASGKLLDSQEFIVFKGSTARIRETESIGRSARGLRQRLVTEGILHPVSENEYSFTEDYIFSSPSAAADTVKGRSSNGWTSWKDERGNTLDENVRK